jgi:TetR/AcrR family transcriptional regulator
MNIPAGTRDPDQTRERILEAAMRCSSSKGFAAVSMREIAARSGVTKSLIHHHFGSKEALWELVKEQAIAAYAERQAAELRARRRARRRAAADGVARLFRVPAAPIRRSCGCSPGRTSTRPELRPARCRAGGTGCRAGPAGPGARAAARRRQSGPRGDDVRQRLHQWFLARNHHAQWPGVGDDASTSRIS